MSKTISTSNTKKQILEAYDELLKQIQQKQEESPKKMQEKQQRLEEDTAKQFLRTRVQYCHYPRSHPGHRPQL